MHTDNEDLKIPEEIRRLISGAKRHHYVSEFLLRRFSIAPHDERPQIYRLEVTTGTIATSSTRDCAVIQHDNRLSDASGSPPCSALALLSYAEGMAAPVIDNAIPFELGSQPRRKLREPPSAPSPRRLGTDPGLRCAVTSDWLLLR